MFITDVPSLNAVKIGNLYFKANNQNIARVANSVRVLTTESLENPDYLGKAGSCTLISWKNDCFVVCTRHQLLTEKDTLPDQKILETARFVSVVVGKTLSNIPTDNCIFVSDNSEEEYSDILIFRAAKDHATVVQERPNFYPIVTLGAIERHLSWIVGYPSNLNIIEYEPQHIVIVGQLFDCSFDKVFSSHSRNLKRFTYDPKFTAVDGFSGGAVFSLTGNTGDLRIVLDGIVLRAGNGFAYIIDVNFLVQALSK